jgi:hypothetical protein
MLQGETADFQDDAHGPTSMKDWMQGAVREIALHSIRGPCKNIGW